jgi:hypothetical protein
MIAPQVLVSLALQYQCSASQVFGMLVVFFKEKLKAKMVLDLWEGIELAHQLGLEEYL